MGGNLQIDFEEPADLFPGGDRVHHVSYRRFKTLAAAVAYSIERLAPAQMTGAAIETDLGRFEATEIRELYRRGDFPIQRRQPQ